MSTRIYINRILENELKRYNINYTYSINKILLICTMKYSNEESIFNLCNMLLESEIPFMIAYDGKYLVYRFGDTEHFISNVPVNITALNYTDLEIEKSNYYKVIGNI